ncbi:type IV secretory system conjugative DNA transfer family protein [Roseibium sp.]|uniref:type IV secretory system conjugative DNA transfer family protein n=1 Tax=Roseibium sp. TaxID=1936156 RepID=UPI003A971A2E
MSPFNEEFRFGSAHWAELHELRRAGLFHPKGPQIGYFGARSLYLDGDAPMITIGGAGSGKLRDDLAYAVCNSRGQRMAILDPRGEISRISMIAHTANGEHAYNWNPMGIAGLPGQSCNPLAILDIRSPNFHADCQFIAESLIPASHSSNGRYFELRAQEWFGGILTYEVERNGKVSLPAMVRVINKIEADPQAWASYIESMLASHFAHVRRIAGEMLVKQQDTPKEFGSILGEIYANTAFLNDPALLAALEGDGFDLSVLSDPRRVAKIFFNVPAEYLSLWSPVLRLFFTVIMLLKSRDPSGPRILLLVDEAGQLGHFEALLRSYTYGRGAGIRTWAIFQDIGQIQRNYGAPALQGFLGSAQMRQFFGVRDYETARLISSMLGTETLSYDDTLKQSEARLQRQEALTQVIFGADPMEVAHKISHYSHASTSRTKQQRPLMSADEIMDMPEDEQIIFISGKDLPPIRANKYPYFTRKEMAGKYLPNPYHPPTDRVRIAKWFGMGWAKVITEPAPYSVRDFPQCRNGLWSYVEGFKPQI